LLLAETVNESDYLEVLNFKYRLVAMAEEAAPMSIPIPIWMVKINQKRFAK
jgi:hypothetical protein